ncbi:hypothetical protein WJ438_00435 [Streptomyces sp. GD-15H]
MDHSLKLGMRPGAGVKLGMRPGADAVKLGQRPGVKLGMRPAAA